MSRHALLSLPIAAALLLPAFSEPVKRDSGREEFSKLLDNADRAFGRKDYLHSVQSLQDGIRIANGMLREALLAGMPLPPRGFIELNPAPAQEHAGDPIGSMMTLAANRPVEMRFRKIEGIGEVRVLVAPNSPAVRAAARALTIAETTPNAEIVEVGKYLGVLTHRRTDFQIRFVIGDAHYVEIRAHGIDPDTVLERVDSKFLDRVARILGT